MESLSAKLAVISLVAFETAESPLFELEQEMRRALPEYNPSGELLERVVALRVAAAAGRA